jgi:hypothetical protein
MPSITFWNRLEPRPRCNDISCGLRAEIRDPVWMLARQRQVGEFRGEDAGSAAYVRLATKTATVSKWLAGTEEQTWSSAKPLDPQVLGEPLTPDLATKAEMGQMFFELLDRAFAPDTTTAKTIKDRFTTSKPLIVPLDNQKTNPFDHATKQFVLMVSGRAADGHAIWLLGQSVPTDVTTDPGQIVKIQTAMTGLDDWVKAVPGGLGIEDAKGWISRRLEYNVSVKIGSSATATLAVQPDEDGSVHWSSFDLAATVGDPFAGGAEQVKVAAPARVTFTGMPAARFWDFESGDIGLPDVQIQTTELGKLLLVDFALIYGVDWFTLPFDQQVGAATKVISLVVTDVFGRKTLVERADKGQGGPSRERWTMFSLAQAGAAVAEFSFLPPAVGQAVQVGAVIEDVRLGRDENANVAWAIEQVTESLIGEPRRGPERDAAVETSLGRATRGTSTEAPLQYLIGTSTPIHWVPLVPVTVALPAPPAIDLERAATIRLDTTNNNAKVVVRAIGKIMNPPGVTTYRLPDEEVPRGGSRVERVVFRSRWSDGSTHLWVARRTRPGAGDTQSGLRFDQALPTAE